MRSLRSRLVISAGLVLAVVTSAFAGQLGGQTPTRRVTSGSSTNSTSNPPAASGPTATSAAMQMLSTGTVQPSALSQLSPGVGVMVNLHGGTFTLVNNSSLYQLNETSAAAAFANAFNGQVDCIDQTGSSCSISDAPPAPAPDPSQMAQAASAQACTFLAGGSLQPASYNQIIVISPVPYDYTWKEYVYHYDVTPNVSVVPPLTAWRFVQAQKTSSKGIPTITVTGEIVNALVTFPQPGVPMYAFMTGGLQSNLQLYVNNKPVVMTQSTVQNCPGCLPGQPGSLDFSFFPNVGTSGDAMSYVKAGNARTILNSDAFNANDDGGPNGSALQEMVFRSHPMQLAPGAYSLKLTGTSAGVSVMVSGNLQILSPSCSVR
jgi:hypothetical protein